MDGVVGDKAHGLTFDADKGGDHADAKVRPELKHGIFVRN